MQVKTPPHIQQWRQWQLSTNPRLHVISSSSQVQVSHCRQVFQYLLFEIISEFVSGSYASTSSRG